MEDKKTKRLVVYYSFEGNTKLIAEDIAKGVDADILELKYKKELKSHGFIKYIWGGMQVIFKKKPELETFGINPKDYDLIYIGTPVWAGSFTPPLRTLFSNIDLKNKNIALFCCHRGGKGEIFEKFQRELGVNNIVGKVDFNDPLKNDREQCIKQGEEWAKGILEKELS